MFDDFDAMNGWLSPSGLGGWQETLDSDVDTFTWRGPQIDIGITIAQAFLRSVRLAREGGDWQRAYNDALAFTQQLPADEGMQLEAARLRADADAYLEVMGKATAASQDRAVAASQGQAVKVAAAARAQEADAERLRCENEMAAKMASGSMFHKALYSMGAIPGLRGVACSLHKSEADGILGFSFLPESWRRAAKYAALIGAAYGAYKVGKLALKYYKASKRRR